MKLLLIIFALLVSSVSAENSNIWTMEQNDSIATATTYNDDGNLFGVYCFRSTCYYLITLDNECEEGSQYPILANSDAGTQSYTLSCLAELKSGYAYTFSNYDAVDSLARLANQVSFAIPVEGIKFRVEKFSLKGNIEVIDKMLKAVVKKHHKATKGYEL